MKKLINKMRRLLITVAVAVAMLFGTGLIAAPSAQAVTYGSPYRVNLGYNHCAVFMYYDYNWWEETFLGKRDGAVYQYRVLC